MKTIVRMAIHLALLTVSLLLLAQVVGLIPDYGSPTLIRRRVLCESLAIHCSLAAEQGDVGRVTAIAQAVADRNPEILSAAVRTVDGKIVAQWKNHAANWTLNATDRSLLHQVQVPITSGKEAWGTVEVCFRPLGVFGGLLFLSSDAWSLVAFVGITSCLAYILYLRERFLSTAPQFPSVSAAPSTRWSRAFSC